MERRPRPQAAAPLPALDASAGRHAVTGLVGLVPLAELLAEAVGSRQGAVRLAAAIFPQWVSALPRGRTRWFTRHPGARRG